MKKILLCLLLSAFSTPCLATSFDCKLAKLDVEKMICNDAELSHLDGRMGSLYFDIMEKTGNNEALNRAIASNQKKWLQEQRNACQDIACLANTYTARLTQLEEVDVALEKESGKTTTNASTTGSSDFIASQPPTQTNLAGTNESKSIEDSNRAGDKTDEKQNGKATSNQIGHSSASTTPPVPVAETSPQGTEVKSNTETNAWQTIKGLAILFAAIFIWHKFFRRRCPSCKSTNYSYLGSQELDRWRQNEKVTETNSRGKSRQRYVSFTYIKNKRSYSCKDCQNSWSEISNEKK